MKRARQNPAGKYVIGADLGTTTTEEVLGKLREKADRKQIKDVQELKRLLKEELLVISTRQIPGPSRKWMARPRSSSWSA